MLAGFYAEMKNTGPKNWRGQAFHESKSGPIFTCFFSGFTKEQAKNEFFEQFKQFLKERGETWKK